MNKQPVTVLIVDDDVELCRTLSHLLEKDDRIQILATSHSAHQALSLVEQHRPNVLLLDIDFNEDINGIDVLKQLRVRDDLDVKVLIYSIFARDETIFKALRAGANSYVWKDESTEDIANAIVDTAEGKAYISTSIAQKLLDHFEKYGHLISEDQLTEDDL